MSDNADRGATSPVRLWEHQGAAVAAAEKAFVAGGRALVVMACGTGKTRVGAELARRVAAGGRTLVVVPTVELVYQTLRGYQDALRLPAEALAGVCAPRAASVVAAEEELDELAAHGVLVSTDRDVLAAHLARPGPVVVVTTYASVRTVADLPGAPWDLVVVDEAHRSAGAAGRTWSVVHDDAVVPARHRLSLTATPRLYRGSADDVISMDDEAVFGPQVYRLTFAAAIRRRLLADYQVLAGVVAADELARLGRLAADGQTVTVGGRSMSVRMLVAQIALIRAVDEHGLTRVVTYHSSVAASRRFAETLLATADLVTRPAGARHLAAEHLDGTTPLAQRRHVLNKLHRPGARTVVVSNCRVLAEGVDVPDLDAVLFASPSESVIDLVQAVGRVLRRGSRDDKIATIIVPVATSGDDPELDGPEWTVLWRVLRALRAHDERLADALDTARSRRGRDTGQLLARWVGATGITVTPALAAAIQLRTVITASSAWWEGYGHAEAFYTTHGSLDGLRRDHHTPDGFPLGLWVGNREAEAVGGRIPAAFRAPLARLGIGTQAENRWWRRGIRALAAFRDREGHVNVPKGHVELGVRLHGFLESRRGEYRKGALGEDRAAVLRSYGVSLDPLAERRETGLRALDRYLHDHPDRHKPPTTWTTPDGFKLGQWVSNRLQEARQGTLHPDVAAAFREHGLL